MRRAVFAALAVMTVAWSAWAAAGGDLRSILQAKYDASCAAEMRKDVRGAFALCAPEWTYTDHKGRTSSLADVLRMWGPRFQACERIEASVRITSLKKMGPNDAHTEVVSVNIYHVVDRAGKKHVITSREVDSDVWQRRNGDWWVVRTRTLRVVDSTTDGKSP